MRKIIWGMVLLSAVLWSCQNNGSAEVSEDTVQTEVGELPEMSIYHLPGVWTDQDSNSFELQELRGKVVVMVMIYTSCKAACPRLIADMRRIEEEVPDEYGDEVQYVMVSIDPDTDTPSRMKNFAI